MANIFNEQSPPQPLTRERQAALWHEFNQAVKNYLNTMSPAERSTVEATRACRVGRFFIAKYRAGAAERGYAAVAAQLRKQGVPLEIARLILLGVQP